MHTIRMMLAAIALVLATTGNAFAINTAYSAILELKAWDREICENGTCAGKSTDVYLVSGEQHACSGDQGTRFLVSPSQHQLFDLLLLALANGLQVSLSYDCDLQGYPRIDGVRARP